FTFATVHYVPYSSVHIATPSFSFSRYPHHLHLHSFPTRRSSDLEARVLVGAELPESLREQRDPGLAEGRGELLDQHLPAAARHRSEEHTSELQSHLNLVCRLLLEKKKKINYRRYNKSKRK